LIDIYYIVYDLYWYFAYINYHQAYM